MTWWAAQLDPKLSQGDILEDLPVAGLTMPVVHLQITQVRGGTGWLEVPKPTPGPVDKLPRFLSRGRVGLAVVLSHDCDIDKPKRNSRVIVAVAASLADLSQEQSEVILAQRSKNMLPLPGLPGHGDCYANLQTSTSVDLRIVEQAKRLASMTSDAKKRLQAQLVAFYTRLAWQPPSGASAEEDD